MKGRCLNPKHPKYHKYGGSGITLCERWLIFENFFADMGHPPTKAHSIDRVKGELGYALDNCRWATPREQSANTTLNRYITFNGKTLHLKDWERLTGISDSSIWYRLEKGWTIEQALTLPPWTRIRSHDGGWPTKRKKSYFHDYPNTE